MKIAWENIDWAYVNLHQRPDRQAHAAAEFAQQGIVPRRVPGLLSTRDTWYPTPLTQRMYNRTPGAIGCWLSQMTALRSAPQDKIAAVCEDDVCFCKDLRERIAYLGAHVPANWDIVWLGATFHCNPPVWHKDTLGFDAKRVGHRIFRGFGIWSTYAYLVNPRSAARILDMMDTYMADSDGIDHCAILYLEPQLNTYFMVPGCAWQVDGQSNIGTGVTEFSAFRRLGPYAWADRMQDFDPDTFNWNEAAATNA